MRPKKRTPQRARAEKQKLTAQAENAKKTPEKKVKPEKAVFPAQATINAYGFIHCKKDVLAAFGVKKGAITKLSIDLDGDKLIIRKA